MKTIYFINPQIIHGSIEQWHEEKSFSMDDWTIYINPELESFFALYDTEHSFQFQLFEQSIPFSQWEELATCSRDILDDFFMNDNKKALGTGGAIVLSEHDCNIFGLIGCITCNDAIAPVIMDYLSSGTLFHVARTKDEIHSPFVAFDEDDNMFDPYTIVALNAMPLESYDVMLAVHHINQALLHEGSFEERDGFLYISYRTSLGLLEKQQYAITPLLREYFDIMMDMSHFMHDYSFDIH